MRRQRFLAGIVLTLSIITMTACGGSAPLKNAYSDTSDLQHLLGTELVRLSGLTEHSQGNKPSSILDDSRISAAAAVTLDVRSGSVLSGHNVEESLSENALYPLAVFLEAENALSSDALSPADICITEGMLQKPAGSNVSGVATGDLISWEAALYGTMLGGYYDLAAALESQLNAAEFSYASAYEAVSAFRNAVLQDSFLQDVQETWHELAWERADGSPVSLGVSSGSHSLSQALEANTGCTVIYGMVMNAGEDEGVSWILYYRTANGKYRISLIAGAEDESSLAEQMEILVLS